MLYANIFSAFERKTCSKYFTSVRRTSRTAFVPDGDGILESILGKCAVLGNNRDADGLVSEASGGASRVEGYCVSPITDLASDDGSLAECGRRRLFLKDPELRSCVNKPGLRERLPWFQVVERASR